jgi:hypothetical protein
VTEARENVNALLDMKESLVKELCVLMTAMTVELAGQRNISPRKLDVSMIVCGTP